MSFAHEDLKQSILSLLRLQEIDAILFRLNEERDKPSKEIQDLQNALNEAQKQLRQAERAWRQVERDRRAYELKHLTLLEDLKKAEAKRNEVRNTKEEFSANKEAENIQRKAAEMKSAMEERAPQVEQKAKGVEEKKKEFSEIEEKLKALQEEREKRLQELENERSEQMAQREQYIAQVNDQIFSMYERVQKLRRGSGVAIVKDSVCTGCFVTLPPQMKTKINKLDDLYTCPSCSRILFPENLLEDQDIKAEAARAQG